MRSAIARSKAGCSIARTDRRQCTRAHQADSVRARRAWLGAGSCELLASRRSASSWKGGGVGVEAAFAPSFGAGALRASRADRVARRAPAPMLWRGVAAEAPMPPPTRDGARQEKAGRADPARPAHHKSKRSLTMS